MSSSSVLSARDHRRLGHALELFSFSDEVGPGLVLWHPRGALLRKLLEDWWRDAHLARGYSLVVSPHVGRGELWERSGHLGFYRDAMFPPMALEHGEYFAKPMNCPFHVQIFKARSRRFRELPLRLAELGVVYRYEPSGSLHGLFRARAFCQDDAHVFCAVEDAEAEVAAALSFARDVLAAVGFADISVKLASRPERFVGALEQWNLAEAALAGACLRAGVEFSRDEGGGAFYGPKLDVMLRDALGREWQCSSVQFDFNLPERFGLSYLDERGEERRPVMLHRALFGSLERFIAILLEHCAGALPAWLSPEQVRVLPVDDAAASFAKEVEARLAKRGVRVQLDASPKNLGPRVRDADALHVPFIAIIGAREVAARAVSLRGRNGESLGQLDLESFERLLDEHLARPPLISRH